MSKTKIGEEQMPDEYYDLELLESGKNNQIQIG